MAPVGVAEGFVQPPGAKVVHADAQGEALVAESRAVFSPAPTRAVPMPRRIRPR